jgi:hypothetical protein
MTTVPTSRTWWQKRIQQIDRRIREVQVEGPMEKHNLRTGEAVITCFIVWRWFDLFPMRIHLYRLVRIFISDNKGVGSLYELRFVEDFRGR